MVHNPILHNYKHHNPVRIVYVERPRRSESGELIHDVVGAGVALGALAIGSKIISNVSKP